MHHWLVKSEPETWSWADHVRKGVEPWVGVRNHQAANFLKAMKSGDLAFFYHSVHGKEIVGVLQVVREAYIDPTDPAGRFVAVDFKALAALGRPVSLKTLRAHPALQGLALLRQSRLSVSPVSRPEWEEILTLGGGLGAKVKP
ncbi:MAG: EVE domain-containing protein [Rhodospirillales bacterium]|nr:EVE domain-containing protein [Rhodospirillales bacterium]